ncbi:MAG: IPExxxVDY family protein [Flavobacteriaceae bacterium]
MSKHLLSFNEINEAFELIAIHSSSEPHDLVFEINRSMGLNLFRTKHDISFKKNNEKYMVYKSDGYNKSESLFLYMNTFYDLKETKSTNLLFNSTPSKSVLLPEVKSVDYIIKYVGEKKNIKYFVKSLSLMKQISSCYSLNKKKIKSVNNLIVD